MNWRERVFWEEGGPEPAPTLSAPMYMGLSPTLMGGGMLVYSKAEKKQRLQLAGTVLVEYIPGSLPALVFFRLFMMTRMEMMIAIMTTTAIRAATTPPPTTPADAADTWALVSSAETTEER